MTQVHWKTTCTTIILITFLRRCTCVAALLLAIASAGFKPTVRSSYSNCITVVRPHMRISSAGSASCMIAKEVRDLEAYFIMNSSLRSLRRMILKQGCNDRKRCMYVGYSLVHLTFRIQGTWTSQGL